MPPIDHTSTANDPQSLLANLGIAGKHVCPFCGSINENPEAACRRCTMENTPLTRQATRARVGPWYVMQSRNPSAPGMKFSTLLALIRRGQVGPRSILRGPTTHQLWRFAVRVKGVSREFGYCYSCSAELQPTAAVCARCSKSQELPANPDGLLEGETNGAKAVYAEVKSKPAGNGDGTISSGEGSSSDSSIAPGLDGTEAAPKAPAPEAVTRSSRPASAPITDAPPAPAPILAAPQSPPSPSATMALVAGLPAPESAGRELQSRPRSQQIERILSPRELAAAFSLQFNPNSNEGLIQPPEMPRTNRRAIAGVIVLVGFFAVAAVVSFVPSIRTVSWGWVLQTYRHAMAPGDLSSGDGSSPAIQTPIHINPSDRPDWAATPPVTPRVILGTDANSQSISGTSANPSSFAALGANGNSSTPNPAATPPDAKQSPAASSANVAATPPTSEELDTLAMQLRRNGLDAEARRDYASAASFYEQIERLPHEHWPSDTDQLLQAARKQTGK
jgi:hypothetical protein